ncbi:MAG: HAMP domain-containing histidine kinase [Deltaproteobacteria bacterium]|nr:HAMP domain-containing histidine kinase [Deltaproteobacteria bacterium]
MNIATKVTLVVMVFVSLLLLGTGSANFSLQRQQVLTAMLDEGRLLAQLLKIGAEVDPVNHGQLGILVEIVAQHPGRSVSFFGPDARVVAPVPMDEAPEAHAPIRQVISSKKGRELALERDGHSLYVQRLPLMLKGDMSKEDMAVGAMELRIDLNAVVSSDQWIRTLVLVAGGLLLLFALVVGFFAHNTIGRPISRLMEGMDAVIRGDLTHALPLDRNDEIGRIAYRFNEMTGRLRSARDEIKASTATKLALEGSLRRSEKLATIGQLSAEIAHEVGTPLNVIGGRARKLTRKAEDPAAVRKNAEIIAQQATRITKIIQQVLDLARAPARHTEPVDLIAIVRDTASFLEYQAEQASVRVLFDFVDELPLLDGNPGELQQVVLNLLLNAIQAMPEGGELKLSICATHRRKGGLDLAPPQAYAQLSVIDHGVGIPEEDHARVFAPFFSTKKQGEGTGLGLTVVSGIVKEHDGWIDIESPEHGGTIFHVFLPVGEPKKTSEEPNVTEVQDDRNGGDV